MTVAMGGKIATPMLPKQGPELFSVGTRQWQFIEGWSRKETEPPLPVRRGKLPQSGAHFEKKQKPMGCSRIPMLADDAGQMQIGRRQSNADLFESLTTSTRIGRFAVLRLEFAARRTPKARVWLLTAVQKQDVTAFIETIQERRDLMREFHPLIQANADSTRKLRNHRRYRIPHQSVQAFV